MTSQKTRNENSIGRIATILLLEPELDANDEVVKQVT